MNRTDHITISTVIGKVIILTNKFRTHAKENYFQKKMSNVTSLTRQIEESVENVDSLLIVLNKLVGIQCPNLRSNHIVIIIIIIIRMTKRRECPYVFLFPFWL